MITVTKESIVKNLRNLISSGKLEFRRIETEYDIDAPADDVYDTEIPMDTDIKHVKCGTLVSIYIPCMMNDAIEFYYKLQNCHIKGDINDDVVKGYKSVDADEKDGRTVLILRHEQGWILTIWFDKCFCEERFYQYHRIWHLSSRDYADVRQIAYWSRLIMDKYKLIGDTAINEEERRLMQLITFSPIRNYSPTDEVLAYSYPDSLEGIQALQYYADAVRDDELTYTLKQYERLFVERRKSNIVGNILNRKKYDRMTEQIINMLREDRRKPLLRHIYKCICEASKMYEERQYDAALMQRINSMREMAAGELAKQGYSNEYPVFKKDNDIIIATEVHPFTIPEIDHTDFDFKITLYDLSQRKQFQVT